jgi:hypothetical protein
VGAITAPVIRPTHRVPIRSRQRRNPPPLLEGPHARPPAYLCAARMSWALTSRQLPPAPPRRGAAACPAATNQSSGPAHSSAPVWPRLSGRTREIAARDGAGVAESASRRSRDRGATLALHWESTGRGDHVPR